MPAGAAFIGSVFIGSAVVTSAGVGCSVSAGSARVGLAGSSAGASLPGLLCSVCMNCCKLYRMVL